MVHFSYTTEDKGKLFERVGRKAKGSNMQILRIMIAWLPLFILIENINLNFAYSPTS